MGNLSGKGPGKARLIDRLVPDMAVEIAIGALRGTERPVQIDAEAGFAVIAIDAAEKVEIRRQCESPVSTKSLKARARCDSAPPSPGPPLAFSSASISPKVR